ncbi:hypothetical protein DY000_02016719 [Brassica cretica]|uniref:F-box associated domain-containing protein n=1 Tax=Brassica cretica TaxID=69181 RepID=A0ABQ7CNT0_BRACR|nr:hypothetical protein DY000_02016719 [Brassica cretica]
MMYDLSGSWCKLVNPGTVRVRTSTENGHIVFAESVYQVYRAFPITYWTSNEGEAHLPRVDVRAHRHWRAGALQ